jgi:Domain of unknown function (DUF397)
MHELNVSRAQWRKSRRSSANGACVEVACLRQTVAVRDSKSPYGPKVAVSPTAWRAFTRTIKDGALA